MVYRTKIASGTNIGNVKTLYADNAIVPSLTATQLGMVKFFAIPPVYTKSNLLNTKTNDQDNWEYIDIIGWNNLSVTDYNTFNVD